MDRGTENHRLTALLASSWFASCDTADSTDPRLATYARLLLGQAYLADTGQLPDPTAFGKALDDLMLRAI